MKTRTVILLATLLFAGTTPGRTAESPQKQPRIEVCFVLDTTGSMSGLIEGAKQKIWSIANEIASAKPTPDIRFGLVGYRDRGDDYVVKTHPLSDDLDAVYMKLNEFRADGGGDTPESVNEALATAIRKMEWSSDNDVLKILFLVGDAPPHMDYDNEPRYPELCAEAVRKDLIINTVQCGDIRETTPVWKEIASKSEGTFAAIVQSGGMRVVETPFDAELSKLNHEMGQTLVAYGDESERGRTLSKQIAATSAPAGAVADRLVFNAKVGKAVQGGGELVEAVTTGSLALEQVKKSDLPEELRDLTPEQLAAEIQKRAEQRGKIQGRITELGAKRAEYLAEEKKRFNTEKPADSFDEEVASTLRKQAARKGISY